MLPPDLVHRSEAAPEPYLPCLICAACSRIASIGGAEYMDQHYPQMPNVGWEVERCLCVEYLALAP